MDVAWMAALREMDQRAMLRDLDAAIERARATGEPRVIEQCLDNWQRLVESMAREPRRERRRRPSLPAVRPLPGSGPDHPGGRVDSVTTTGCLL